ncbi:MAG: YdcF family protein [Clostridia bacterium]|nr:YdcF family protein [Clostridia bacterium]MBQ6809423.1 YdcF family protein [Clostridia bacterium]
MKRNWKKIIICVVIIGACIAVLGGLTCLGVNIYVRNTVSERILSVEEAADIDADCILVLGSGIKLDGTPGKVLTDRLDKGLALYEIGASPKLLMSGDHGRVNYDEVNAMKNYAMERGVASEDVFMDHAGFSTYESMYRAAAIFEVEKTVIVTQKYHLYRSIYNALSMGIDAYGVASDLESYRGSFSREIRECLAIVKDFVYCIFQPKPTYLGDVIPVSGNGDLTNG